MTLGLPDSTRELGWAFRLRLCPLSLFSYGSSPCWPAELEHPQPTVLGAGIGILGALGMALADIIQALVDSTLLRRSAVPAPGADGHPICAAVLLRAPGAPFLEPGSFYGAVFLPGLRSFFPKVHAPLYRRLGRRNTLCSGRRDIL